MGRWYENAVIYEVDVKTYVDSSGNGVGDLTGLASAVDYLAGLGVTCLWLLPFYASPGRDNGYDVEDHLRVDPRIGDVATFVELLERADQRGIRVIVDLVANHTSIDHPWFQEARRGKQPFRDYYVWKDEKPEDDAEDVVFGQRQGTNWTYDEVAGKYYYHTFYSHEADLNLTNPRVRGEIRKIMNFWLRLGVSGFRVDAVPHMLREKGDERFDIDPHDMLREFSGFVHDRRPDALLLAEADAEPGRYAEFFGDGDQMQMLFNFYLASHLFLAFVREEAEPIVRALRDLPKPDGRGQYATFLRNHDELDLERLSEAEREEVYRALAPEERMRAFGRGIRRRLAPMLGGDRRKLELAFSLLLTLPGTPVIYYGDEIGMGEDLSLDERNSVRTPMQWSNRPNAGFSKAAPDRLLRPVIADGEYGFERLNVNDQRRDPGSLLNWLSRAVHLRNEFEEFGRGGWEILDSPAEVLALEGRWGDHRAVAIHNLSGRELDAEVVLEDREGLLEVFGDQQYDPGGERPGRVHLGPYGYRWFRSEALP